jgi:hypothetical protein
LVLVSDHDDEDFEDQDSEPVDPLTILELERLEYGERLASVYLQGAGDLLAMAKLEPDWLVPNAVPAAAVSFFVGKPGAAKSWLAYDLACAVVQKRDWMGFGTPTVGPSPCAFILNFDNPHSECARRFLRLGLVSSDALWVHSWGAHSPPEPFPSVLQLPDAFEPLEAMVYAKRPALVVIDSLRQAHTGDESSSQEMARVMSQVKRFATLGAAVVIVHHTRKNDGAMRGSTEIEATADSITDVEKDDAQVSVVSWRKTRGWDMAESTMTVRLVDDGDRTYVRGGKSLAALLREQGPMTRTAVQTALNLPQTIVKKLIERALERGAVTETRVDGTRLIELVTFTGNEAPP